MTQRTSVARTRDAVAATTSPRLEALSFLIGQRAIEEAGILLVPPTSAVIHERHLPPPSAGEVFATARRLHRHDTHRDDGRRMHRAVATRVACLAIRFFGSGVPRCRDG